MRGAVPWVPGRVGGNHGRDSTARATQCSAKEGGIRAAVGGGRGSPLAGGWGPIGSRCSTTEGRQGDLGNWQRGREEGGREQIKKEE